ncbi:MAG TPA: APC family permease [Anaerolineales bacterium]|jgi:amino acid transporter
MSPLAQLRILLTGPPTNGGGTAPGELPKWRALAAFSPDGLSSIAYANQEIYLALSILGSAGLAFYGPVAVAIVGLLIVVTVSYSQSLSAYPSGGGSYSVASQNLGPAAGQLAGASILVAYLLTAAVSLTAGLEAIASALPWLWPYKLPLALAVLVIITLVNLRGAQEMSWLMVVPVYGFLGAVGFLLVSGWLELRPEISVGTLWPGRPPQAGGEFVLRAFASGCTALTGIEAISNGVPSFQRPRVANARATLLALGGLMAVLFLGSALLVQRAGLVVEDSETILSALARHVLGSGLAYYLMQAMTLAILAVAANTSFAGFPRIAAMLAKDGYLPRQLSHAGDRMVFSNAILLLAGGTALVMIGFGGESHRIVPLFAVGVFIAFTLSQAGMVSHWIRQREVSWGFKATWNALGASITLGAIVILTLANFVRGAWLVFGALVLLVWLFRRIRYHYDVVRADLTLRGLPPSLKPRPPARLVIPVSGVHRGVVEAVNLARSISNQIVGAYVELEPDKTPEVLKDWSHWFPDLPLEIIPSPKRNLVAPLLAFLDKQDLDHNDGQLAAVVLPEFVPARWWHSLLHNQTAWILKAALLYRRRRMGFQRVIIDVPYHLRH